MTRHEVRTPAQHYAEADAQLAELENVLAERRKRGGELSEFERSLVQLSVTIINAHTALAQTPMDTARFAPVFVDVGT